MSKQPQQLHATNPPQHPNQPRTCEDFGKNQFPNFCDLTTLEEIHYLNNQGTQGWRNN